MGSSKLQHPGTREIPITNQFTRARGQFGA
jgi:hypothetical protein